LASELSRAEYGGPEVTASCASKTPVMWATKFLSSTYLYSPRTFINENTKLVATRE
jgi:hypothetical protein